MEVVQAHPLHFWRCLIDTSSLPCAAYFSAVISTLLTFVTTFRKAHEENLKQAELEKKKAEKDAEAEKAKSAQLTSKNVLILILYILHL